MQCILYSAISIRHISQPRRIITYIVFSYIYTAFMRLTEMIEKYKTKYRSEGKVEN